VVGTDTEPPLTTPVVGPTVAKAGLLLLQSPPGAASVNVIVAPEHTVPGPDIGLAAVVTVIVLTAEQPSGIVYKIFAVPADTPPTDPVEPTLATVISLLLQLPPATTSPSVIELPAQTRVGPVIGSGAGFTVKVPVILQPVVSGKE